MSSRRAYSSSFSSYSFLVSCSCCLDISVCQHVFCWHIETHSSKRRCTGQLCTSTIYVMYMTLWNDCFRNVYANFLCRLVCTCIHESHAELTSMCLNRRFNILCYASGFYMLLFLRQMFMMHVCVCVCVCVCVFVCVCVCVCVCMCVCLHTCT